jgi:predicted DNA-binding transcriptional regulator AlpA
MGALHNVAAASERHGHTDIETARLLGVSVATVRRWRLTGQGPKYRKFGGAVRYFPEDIESFIATSPSGGGITTEAR